MPAFKTAHAKRPTDPTKSTTKQKSQPGTTVTKPNALSPNHDQMISRSQISGPNSTDLDSKVKELVSAARNLKAQIKSGQEAAVDNEAKLLKTDSGPNERQHALEEARSRQNEKLKSLVAQLGKKVRAFKDLKASSESLGNATVTEMNGIAGFVQEMEKRVKTDAKAVPSAGKGQGAKGKKR